jgi:regulatory protein
VEANVGCGVEFAVESVRESACLRAGMANDRSFTQLVWSVVSDTAVPWHRPPMAGAPQHHGVGPAPDAAGLHDAALAYLARYAATEATLCRVLERRVARWARAAAATDPDAAATQAAMARLMVRDVVARLVAAGAVNDAAFAEARARSLVRAGRSRRAAAAHLAAKGVDPATARTALADDDTTELAAALVLARKRRIGPFRLGEAVDEVGRRREFGMLARAGFPQDVARRALTMDADEAETLVNRLRR